VPVDKLFWAVDDSSASAPTATPSASTNASSDTPGHVGDTLTIADSRGDAVHVTLVQVFDPATGVNPDTTPPMERAGSGST
jgi:hypothetical protein